MTDTVEESSQTKESDLVISGASRGIGFALGVEAYRRNHRVFGCARHPSKAMVPPPFDLHKVDVSQPEAVEIWLKNLPLQPGWKLVINHGILGPRKSLKETDTLAFARVLEVNGTGSFYLLHGALNLPVHPAVICLVSSSAGRQGRENWGAYAASKAVVESLVQTLSEEVSPEETLVFSFNPGGTATIMRTEAYPKEDPTTLPSATTVGAILLDLVEEAELTLHGQAIDGRDYL